MRDTQPLSLSLRMIAAVYILGGLWKLVSYSLADVTEVGSALGTVVGSVLNGISLGMSLMRS